MSEIERITDDPNHSDHIGHNDAPSAIKQVERVQEEARLEGVDEGYLTQGDIERACQLLEQYKDIHPSCTVYVAPVCATERMTTLKVGAGGIQVRRVDVEGEYRARPTGFYIDYDFKADEDREAYETLKEMGFNRSKRLYLEEEAGTNDYPGDEEAARARLEAEKAKIEARQYGGAEYVAELRGLDTKYRFDRRFLDQQEGGYDIDGDKVYEIKRDNNSRTYLCEGKKVTADWLEEEYFAEEEERQCWECGGIYTRSEIKHEPDAEWDAVGEMCYCGC